MRVAFLLALLLVPGLAGCLGDGEAEGERLAVPTDKPLVVPTRADPRGTSSVNLSDPGYRMNGTWRVGDGWDYESDRGRVLRVRVVEARNVTGGTHFLIEERVGLSSAGTLPVFRSWVDGRTWTRLNQTEPGGSEDRYQPGAPLRFFRNASVPYNVTRYDVEGEPTTNYTTTLHVRLRPTHQTLLFPWGYVEARVVDEIAVDRLETGQRSQRNTTRWVHADYLNDLQLKLDSGETFKLVAARLGDIRRGTLKS